MSIIFRQLQCNTSKTFTYFLACSKTKETVIIDPVDKLAERDSTLLNELGFLPKYAINTHCHADHVTGTNELKKYFPELKSVISESSGAQADKLLKNREQLVFGEGKVLKCLNTPGHTNGCMSFVSEELKGVFTGDTLMIRKCGRTDFQEGSSEDLYDSVYREIFTLPDDFIVWPGHDYKMDFSHHMK